MSVLILGAGGFLGLNTVDALLARGVTPRCGRRKRSNVLGLRQRRVPLVEADLEQPATLREAMRGCHTVLHLAGHYPRLSTEPALSTTLSMRQTHAVLDAAAAAGVARLIYVSSTATVASRPDRPSDEADVFSSAPDFGTYHHLKWHMEQLVAAERRVPTVTVCPGACLGPYDWKIGTSALLWQLRRGQWPAHPDGIVSWVDVRDVAEALARLVDVPRPPPRLLLAAQSVGFHDFLSHVAERYGVTPGGPPLSAEAATALADREEARVTVEGGRPQLAREIVDLIVHGARLDCSLARRLLALDERPLEQTLSAFDAWAQQLEGPHRSPRTEVHA